MEKMQSILRTAISNVMEKMYFLLPDEEYSCSDESSIKDKAYIGILGDPGYIMSFSAERALLLNMTADFLGLEKDEINEETLQNCLFETANVIGGRVLLSFGDDNSRNITLPCTKKEDVFGEYKSHNKVTVKMSFDGYGFIAKIESVAMGK